MHIVEKRFARDKSSKNLAIYVYTFIWRFCLLDGNTIHENLGVSSVLIAFYINTLSVFVYHFICRTTIIL